MDRVEHHERQWSETEHRQPRGQGWWNEVVASELLAQEFGPKKNAAEHEAQTGADEDVPVLIAQDDRQPHEHQDHSQNGSGETHVEDHRHG